MFSSALASSMVSIQASAMVRETFLPQLGFHYGQAMELSTGSTTTYAGGSFSWLTVSLWM